MYFSSSTYKAALLNAKSPQIVWVLESPDEGEWWSAQVLQRLSIIAHRDLLSSTLKNLSFFILNKLVMRPSLHSSDSGTSLTGRASLILVELYHWGWSSSLSIWKYRKFTQVVDLGSLETILSSNLTSLLGDCRRFRKNQEYLDSTWFLKLVCPAAKYPSTR